MALDVGKKKKTTPFDFFAVFFLGWDLLGNIIIYLIIIIGYGCFVFLRLRSSANKLEILKKIVIWIDRNGPTLMVCLDG